MIRVAHIITTLSTGGAETMLHKLLCSMDGHQFAAEVYSLSDVGSTGAKIAATLGIPVFSLKQEGGRQGIAAAARLITRLRRYRPSVIQTWMYHANLLGGLAGRAIGKPVIWNIRRGGLGHLKRRTRLISQACSALSLIVPQRIVCCSADSMAEHAAAGYARTRMSVIPNGFDLSSFRPDPGLRESLRNALGIGPNTPLFGLVARFDPAKDHETFLRSAALIHHRRPDARFLLCGKNVDSGNANLMTWLEQLNLRGCCTLLGLRDDIPGILASLDVLVSSSVCEGFPNVLGEAMACSVPCVATDVGDSALVLGETGRVVSPRNAEALAARCVELIDIGPAARAEIGAAARLRIRQRFSMPAIASQYQDLYREVAGTCAA